MKALKIIGAGLREVVRDCIREYDAARATGDAASICVHAGLVREACIQAHDEKCAKEWAEIEKRDCGGTL